MARALSLVCLAAAALAANGDPNATIYFPSAPGFTNPTVTGASVVGAEPGRTTLALCVPEGGGRCPVTVTQEDSTQRFHFGMKISDVSIPDVDCTLQPKQESAACQGGAKAGQQEVTFQNILPVSQVAVPITASAEKLAANPGATATSSGGEGRSSNSAGATGSREPVSSSASGNAARAVTTHNAVLAVAVAVGCAIIL